jgi:hypothetical protein
MKSPVCFFFFLFILLFKNGIAQDFVNQPCDAGILICAWDRTIPLTDFIKKNNRTDEAIILIGYSDKSVFSVELSEWDNSKGIFGAEIVETDTCGVQKTWSSLDIFGFDIVNDKYPSRAARNQLHPKVNLHFEKLNPIEAWACPYDYSWLAKANSKQLNKCFTWYYDGFHCLDDGPISTNYVVKITPYNNTRELRIFESVLTVPLPCHIDTISKKFKKIIFDNDTIEVHKMDDTLSPIPFRWLRIVSYGDSIAMVNVQFEMNHPDSALQNEYPLLKTHRAELVENKFWVENMKRYEYESIILLTPLKKESGKIYVIDPYDCVEKHDYVIVETKNANISEQNNYLRIFGTMRDR